MQPGSVVRIRNTSDRTWKDGYNGLTYQALPGGEAIAPFEAACLWFGHPDAIDLGPGKTYRTDEYLRMRTRYGVLDVLVEDPNSGHNVHTMEPCCPFTQEDQWKHNIPPVEVFDIDGNRIIMVIDDPEGSAVTPSSTSVAQQEILQTQLAAMQNQMAQLQAQLDAQTRGEAAEANSGPIPDDQAPAMIPGPGSTGPIRSDIPDPDAEVTEDSPTRVRVSN